MDPTRPRYLKCEEAAKVLGISAWTLRHWVCDRKITFVRKGRMVRFRLEDLERQGRLKRDTTEGRYALTD